jgi:hypothetical protein
MNDKLRISNNLAVAILLATIARPAQSDEVNETIDIKCHGQGVNDSGAIVIHCDESRLLALRASDETWKTIKIQEPLRCQAAAIANNGTAFAHCTSNGLRRAYVWLPQQNDLTTLLPALGHDRATISSVTPFGVAIGTTIDRQGRAHPALWRSPTERATELKVGLLGTEGKDCVANSAEDENTIEPAVAGSCPISGSSRRTAIVWRRDGVLFNYVAHPLPFPHQSDDCKADLVVGNKVVGTCTFIEGTPRAGGVYTVAWYGTDAPKVLTPDGEPSISQPVGVLKDGSVAGHVRYRNGAIGDRAFIWRPVNDDLTIFSTTLDPDHPEFNVRPVHYSESGYLVGIAEREVPGGPFEAVKVTRPFRLNSSTGTMIDLSDPTYPSLNRTIRAVSKSGCFAVGTGTALPPFNDRFAFKYPLCGGAVSR